MTLRTATTRTMATYEGRLFTQLLTTATVKGRETIVFVGDIKECRVFDEATREETPLPKGCYFKRSKVGEYLCKD